MSDRDRRKLLVEVAAKKQARRTHNKTKQILEIGKRNRTTLKERLLIC